MTISIQILLVPEAETVQKREFYLSDDEVTIGRDFSADITLPDSQSAMSRKHVKITRVNGERYTVTDLSTNGAAINGEAMTKDAPKPVADGDVLEFCGYRMLLGIVTAPGGQDAETGAAPTQRFAPETDLDTDGPLLADSAVEQEAAPEERGFEGEPTELDADLMFDPFADGPALREPAAEPEPNAEEPVQMPQTVSDGVFTALAPREDTSAALVAAREAETRARFYKVAADEAMQRAFDRFLQEIDPELLQDEFDTYMSVFANRKKRYWQIYKRKFAKQRQTGELRRAFMALFAEEMRRK